MNVFKLVEKLDKLGAANLKLNFARVEEDCIFGSFTYLGSRYNIDVFNESIVVSCFNLPNGQLFHECESIKELIQILKEV